MIRIYIMNFYKNTRGKGVPLDNTGFFAYEQIFASISMVAFGAFFLLAPTVLGWSDPRLGQFSEALTHLQLLPVLSGVPFGAVAFFSVFIFMFPGRTATFAGLVNRLTSLVAGTTATVLLAVFFKNRMPNSQEWLSLLFILIAVYFLTRAEKMRVAEGITVDGDGKPVTAPASVPAPGPAKG
jgi:drug/metabolite transporter (DMT)-like permease